MKKISPRAWTLLITGLALVGLFILASSLGTLQLSEGHPVPPDLTPPKFLDETLPNPIARWLLALMRVFFVVAWLSIPFLIIYFILNKEARKRFLRNLITFLPVLIILLILSSVVRPSKTGQPIDLIPPAAATLSPDMIATPYPVPEYTEPPSWITTATSLAIGVGISLLLAGVVMVILRQRQNQKAPLRLVEEQAQAAIDLIEAGGDLREAILRCYFQMIEAVKEYRGIHRGKDMTPHEFELFLEQQGLPREAIQQLTVLFEQVRYGGQVPGRQEERNAINSLTAIVSACQRTRAA